jgi:TolB protein
MLATVSQPRRKDFASDPLPWPEGGYRATRHRERSMMHVTPTTSDRGLMRALVAMLAAIATWSGLPAVAHAAFPGTNGKLAYGSARSGYPADNDLYTMADNGTGETRITSMNLDELNAAWSPSGAEIAFERTNGLRSDIWIAKADGTNLRQLTTHPANDTRPAFSNAGTKIVFASDRNSTAGTSDLFVMDANGANQVAITNTPTIDESYPAWSPDGTAIAFSRDGDIYKVSPSGANLTRLTSSVNAEIEPDWSPNSGQIVFRQGINADDELWKMNANGTGQFMLTTNGSVPEERPVWSPLGDKIAFIRGAFKAAEVYTMNPDGSGATRITNNTVMDASPAWQAIPSAPPPGPPPLPPAPPIPSTPPPSPPMDPGSSSTSPGSPGMNLGLPLGLAGTAVPPVTRASLEARKVRLALLIRRGIRISMTCPEPCSFDVRLLRSKKVLGRSSGRMSAAATRSVTVKPDKRARRALRRRSPPKLTVSVVVRGADGGLLLKHRRGIRVQSD